MNWARATDRQIRHARHNGALVPTHSTSTVIRDSGIDYVVRLIERAEQKPGGDEGKSGDPFAPPYDPDLCVGDVTPTHAALLNKFPVLDRHLLIVTRAFEPQTSALSVSDFEALLCVLRGWDGLAFYNAGLTAGASQPHRHLQIVDQQVASAGSELPLTDALAASTFDGAIGYNAALPFPNTVARMPADAIAEPGTAAPDVRRLYLAMLDAIERPAGGGIDPGPYNLLATRDWLWAVPRRCSGFQGIEVNALGFAGALLVGDTQQLAELRANGPGHYLRSVAHPAEQPI